MEQLVATIAASLLISDTERAVADELPGIELLTKLLPTTIVAELPAGDGRGGALDAVAARVATLLPECAVLCLHCDTATRHVAPGQAAAAGAILRPLGCQRHPALAIAAAVAAYPVLHQLFIDVGGLRLRHAAVLVCLDNPEMLSAQAAQGGAATSPAAAVALWIAVVGCSDCSWLSVPESNPVVIVGDESDMLGTSLHLEPHIVAGSPPALVAAVSTADQRSLRNFCSLPRRRSRFTATRTVAGITGALVMPHSVHLTTAAAGGDAAAALSSGPPGGAEAAGCEHSRRALLMALLPHVVPRAAVAPLLSAVDTQIWAGGGGRRAVEPPPRLAADLWVRMPRRSDTTHGSAPFAVATGVSTVPQPSAEGAAAADEAFSPSLPAGDGDLHAASRPPGKANAGVHSLLLSPGPPAGVAAHGATGREGWGTLGSVAALAAAAAAATHSVAHVVPMEPAVTPEAPHAPCWRTALLHGEVKDASSISGAPAPADSSDDDSVCDIGAADGVRIGHWPGISGVVAARRRLDAAVVRPVVAARCNRGDGDGGAAAGDATELRALARAMRRMRVSPATGVLLWGPSGCGKSALGAAIARTARLRLVRVACAALLSRFVGDSEAALREVFASARALAPCVLLLDDVDVIAGVRGGAASSSAGGRSGADAGGGRPDGPRAPCVARPIACPRDASGDDGAGGGDESGSEWRGEAPGDDGAGGGHARRGGESLTPTVEGVEAITQRGGGGHVAGPPAPPPAVTLLDRMLATLLNEMDGVGHARGDAAGGGACGQGALRRYVLVVGTTSGGRGALDPALLRPGRLEVHVRVGRPREAEALALLRRFARTVRLADDVDLALVARAAVRQRASAAALRAVVAAATVAAVRERSALVHQRHLVDALK